MRPFSFVLSGGPRESTAPLPRSFYAAFLLVLLSLGAALAGAMESRTTIARLTRLAASSGLTPESLQGMTKDDAATLFGTPAFMRHEGNIDIWQYHKGNCVMDLFMYPASTGTPAVKHAELRARETDTPINPTRCLARLSEATEN